MYIVYKSMQKDVKANAFRVHHTLPLNVMLLSITQH